MLESANDLAEGAMDFSKYKREQLIAALNNEYEYLCHDNFDPDVDWPPAKMLEYCLNPQHAVELNYPVRCRSVVAETAISGH